MGLWELTKSPGDFPSEQGAVLGVTAVLVAALVRLPARDRGIERPRSMTGVGLLGK